MNNIPIFDSLTHPTIDSNWILPRYPNVAGINNLKQQMEKSNVKWSFAVGMKNIGKYEEKEYIRMIKTATINNIFPIAFLDPNFKSNIKFELLKIKKLGYFGIKLHPRISNFYYETKIATIIKIANDLNLVCLLCTYPYGNNHANKNTPEKTMQMLAKTNGAKVILIHSGAVRLLEYMEIARSFNNVLLDLSLTLCKYEGSSLDLDINYLFKKFDRRICVGSDYPEISLMKMRERFNFFSKDISINKKVNIAYKNIASFCEIKIL